MAGHLPVESLSAYLDGEAAPLEARRVAAHVAVCAACRERLEGLRQTVRALGCLHLEAAAPPATLAALVQARIAAEASEAGRALPDAAAARVRTGAWPHLPWHPPHPRHGRPSGRTTLASRFGLFWQRWRRSRRSRPSQGWQGSQGWQEWMQGLAGLVPSRASFSAPLAAGLVLLMTLLAIEHGTPRGLGAFHPTLPRTVRLDPQFRVSEVLGEAPVVLPQTTSEVAGRVFVYSDDVWVQRGLDDSDVREPGARVRAASPQGRALLARYGDLAVLIADGSRVVLRDRVGTLELWNGS